MKVPTDPDAAGHDEAANPSRKRATLARLLKEARLAFSEKGLAGARVDDIARAAGVTKQLVYHYFQSKEQLFANVLDESAQDLLADLLTLELDHLPPTDALRVLLKHLFDMYRDDPTLGALAQAWMRSSRVVLRASRPLRWHWRRCRTWTRRSTK